MEINEKRMESAAPRGRNDRPTGMPLPASRTRDRRAAGSAPGPSSRAAVLILVVVAAATPSPSLKRRNPPRNPFGPDLALIAEGLQTFRFDTFGDEAFWGGTAAAPSRPSRPSSPEQALGLGLKVDSEALPSHLMQQLRRGQVDLDDPAVDARPAQAQRRRRA